MSVNTRIVALSTQGCYYFEGEIEMRTCIGMAPGPTGAGSGLIAASRWAAGPLQRNESGLAHE